MSPANFPLRSSLLLAGMLCLFPGSAQAESRAWFGWSTVQVYPVDPPPVIRQIPDPNAQPAGSPPPARYIPQRYTWQRRDAWRPAPDRVSPASPGLRGALSLRPVVRMPGPIDDATGLPWSVGASSWLFTGEQDFDVSVGSQQIAVPDWGREARLGGINIAGAPGQDADSVWRYSVALGALDEAVDQSQGDLSYGKGAGHAFVSYGLEPGLTLQSQMGVAPGLVNTGVGGEYQTDWGAWTAGVARASAGLYKGWRFQTEYRVSVLDDIELSWLNERLTPGYADLSTYGGTPGGGATRQQWSATVPTGRWGDISGTFESLDRSAASPVRSFGFTQQFWYSPNLRVGLRAQREFESGDYDVGIRFSIPVF
ncbi:hypothetical protein ERD78_02120 [Allopusillimonas soli]|uniref:Transporter n=1 Tax=Allopusillimonas soli TaxID=659016 RepID=A0A853F571_9BURK|nr:hypothetical protein [Allopusillimonas soli]NYT35654.1 hypothetical protein [Allopusillimonas soli]TEA76048.1 hypothetical protein ERD78_02120 [Allopusillimonas soli]